MDPVTRGFMESRFGHDFSRVRVHVDPLAAESASKLEARAYTVGTDVVFGAGQYAPHTPAGKGLVAHELAHVLQQRIAPAHADSYSVLDPAEAFEREARDVEGAVRIGGPILPLSDRPAGIARASWTEKWHALWGVGPIDAHRASEIADEASAAAQKTGLPGPYNGPADAWRHCFWNCRMTQSIGADQAETIATNHERDNPGPMLESIMDLHNNDRGRTCVGSSCDSCCQTKLDTAQLLVIDPTTGSLVPSSPTPRGGPTQAPVYKNY